MRWTSFALLQQPLRKRRWGDSDCLGVVLLVFTLLTRPTSVN